MKKEGEKGFVMLIVMVILGLAALKYFLNWDIFDAATSDQGKTTITYVRDIVNGIWAYIGYPLTYAWNNVVWPLLGFAVESLKQMIGNAQH
jgi:hypothetical protein